MFLDKIRDQRKITRELVKYVKSDENKTQHIKKLGHSKAMLR